MSDTKHSDTQFTNEDTVQRRAWIDRALACVKGDPVPQDPKPESRDPAAKPHLYVVKSNQGV
jgi:hypothetical protein